MKALVVFSGGQDSTTCLGWAKNRYQEVETITFLYGQKHAREVDQAKTISQKFDVKNNLIKISSLQQIGDSALVTNGDVNQKRPGTDLPASFVPNRNTLFLTIAHALAQKIGAKDLITGVCQTDFSGYYDCREEYIRCLENTLNIGSFGYKLSLDWLAGFIEGEGCFSRGCYKTKKETKYYPTFSLEQAEKEILVLIKETLGIGNIRKRKKIDSSRLDSWEYKLSYYECQNIYNLMKDRIRCSRKTKQFLEWEKEHEYYLKKNNKGIITEAFKKHINIKTPLMYLNKAQTFQMAEKEGCLDIVLSNSITCYNAIPIHHTWGWGCGDCPACELRMKGWEEYNRDYL